LIDWQEEYCHVLSNCQGSILREEICNQFAPIKTHICCCVVAVNCLLVDSVVKPLQVSLARVEIFDVVNTFYCRFF